MSTFDNNLEIIAKIRQQNAERQRRRRAKMTKQERDHQNRLRRLRRANMSDRPRKRTDIQFIENMETSDDSESENALISDESSGTSKQCHFDDESSDRTSNEDYNGSAAELCVTEVTEYDDNRVGISKNIGIKDEEANEVNAKNKDESSDKLDHLAEIVPEAKIKTEILDVVEIKKEKSAEDIDFKSEPSLDLNVERNRDSDNYCGKVEDNETINENHLNELPLSVQISENDNKYLSCDICNYRTIKTTALKRHMWIHSGRKIYECSLCDYKTIESSTFKRHMMTHTGEKPYACSFCEYKTTQSCNFKRHMMTHNKPAPNFDCELCDFKTDRSTLFAKHMSTHTNQKPYGCNLCHYRTTQRSRVKRHMLTHTGEKSFSCDLCVYKTAQFSNYKRHMLTHTKEKLYGCELCDYKTTQSSNVKRHMVIHKQMKMNTCKQCDFKTIQTAAFKAHMATHNTKEKVYNCNFCNYITVNPNALKVHIMLHTGEKPYSCNLCDYKTAQCSNIRRHMLTHITEKKSLTDEQLILNTNDISNYNKIIALSEQQQFNEPHIMNNSQQQSFDDQYNSCRTIVNSKEHHQHELKQNQIITTIEQETLIQANHQQSSPFLSVYVSEEETKL